MLLLEEEQWVMNPQSMTNAGREVFEVSTYLN